MAVNTDITPAYRAEAIAFDLYQGFFRLFPVEAASRMGAAFMSGVANEVVDEPRLSRFSHLFDDRFTNGRILVGRESNQFLHPLFVAKAAHGDRRFESNLSVGVNQ